MSVTQINDTHTNSHARTQTDSHKNNCFTLYKSGFSLTSVSIIVVWGGAHYYIHNKRVQQLHTENCYFIPIQQRAKKTHSSATRAAAVQTIHRWACNLYRVYIIRNLANCDWSSPCFMQFELILHAGVVGWLAGLMDVR